MDILELEKREEGFYVSGYGETAPEICKRFAADVWEQAKDGYLVWLLCKR